MERRALAVHSLGAERYFLRFQFGPFGSPLRRQQQSTQHHKYSGKGDNFPAIQEIDKRSAWKIARRPAEETPFLSCGPQVELERKAICLPLRDLHIRYLLSDKGEDTPKADIMGPVIILILDLV